ncbi:MAG: hypothetical protein DMF92_15215 [Acidobacteria bacterium]|nr:MAG: hypothetical protein DMF92_15215 [Acidobacteriota bacterium]
MSRRVGGKTSTIWPISSGRKAPEEIHKALVDECTEDARFKRRRRVDFPFEKRNTGFEGLSAVRRNGRDYLLALRG